MSRDSNADAGKHSGTIKRGDVAFEMDMRNHKPGDRDAQAPTTK